MDEAAFVPLGRVVKPHGLDGELSVRIDESVAGIPTGVVVWFVPPPDGPRSGRITAVRQGPKGPLITVEGISHIAQAEPLRGCDVVARPADLPPDLVHTSVDLRGLEVTDTERGYLGSVSEVILTGANDVLVVESTAYGQVLIPVIDDVIVSLDADAGTCVVRLLPGLIEEES